MSDRQLYEIVCNNPWHEQPEYDDGGPHHYVECYVPAVGVVSLDAIDRARIPCEHNRYERHRTCGCVGILHSHHGDDPVEWFWCDPWAGVGGGDDDALPSELESLLTPGVVELSDEENTEYGFKHMLVETEVVPVEEGDDDE